MEEHEQLLDFFETIYGANEGFVYLAFKDASKTQKNLWRPEWYSWPSDKSKLVTRILDQTGRSDVYYGPSLYRTKNATKEAFRCSQWLWVDFDGNAGIPDLCNPEPTIVIRSSVEGREHWYWKIDNPISDISVLEQYNRNLAYELQADTSGWDATQVLRPPLTQNHKRGIRTEVRQIKDSVYDLSAFSFTKEPPPTISLVDLDTLPDVKDVLAKYSFKAETTVLFKKGANEGKRGMGLMALAYSLCELGLPNEEVVTLLYDADSRWGKFHERNDTDKRLLEILSVARGKYPYIEDNPLQELPVRLQVFGFDSLIKAEAMEIEWLWDGFLQKAGYLLLTGPPKVGKTQFSLDFGARAVLGKDFLGRHTRPDLKIGFLSLEMGAPELQLFLKNQAQGLTKEELGALEERYKMIPVGEPYYVSRQREQDDLEEMIHELSLDGLIIDSMGSTMEGELTNERDAKSLMDWNDRIRRRHDCFTWFIHHHRKATGDNKKPKGLADIYGSYIFTARVTTALTLWGTGGSNSIQLIPNAVRLAETPSPFLVFRDSKLRFTTKKSSIVVTKSGENLESLEGELVSDEEFGSGKFSY